MRSKCLGIAATLKGRASRLGFLLGVGTSFVLLSVLAMTWATNVEAACATFGSAYCPNPGNNPCNYGTCTATGPGYLCSVGGVNQTELYYKLTGAPLTWNRCTYNGSSTITGTCSESYVNCGTVTHYTNPVTASCFGNSCIGTWTWTGCQASGNCK